MLTSSSPDPTSLHLRPFRAVRYNPDHVGDLSHVVSPAYDDITPAHARALRNRPHHIARLLYSHEPESAAGQLQSWLQRGVLRQDAEPALYVYQQQRGARILQRGVLGELLLPRTPAASVLPHEEVLPHVVNQRAALMSGLRAQLEPLLLTYRSTESTAAQIIERLTYRPPMATARAGTTTHHLWSCTDPDDLLLIAAELARSSALIADGHHRHAACLQLSNEQQSEAWQSSLALLVDSTIHPLHLTPIHRVMPGLEPAKAVKAAAEVAHVAPLAEGFRAPRADEMIVAGDGRAWVVTDPEPQELREALAGCPALWQLLPAAIADRLLLARAWSVPDLPGP